MIAAVALFAALIPFGVWSASFSSVLIAKAREKAAIAAIPKVTLPAKASGIVIESADWLMMNCARDHLLSGGDAVAEVLTRGQSKSPYLRFTRATAHSPVDMGQAAESAPADYILIQFPDRPQFFQTNWVLEDIAFPAVEIYAVDSSGKKLVAATYTAFDPLPAFPPMWTMSGWYHRSNSATPAKQCRSVAQFLQQELLDKLG